MSGTARGVDRAGERWANRRGVGVERFPADWEGQGKSAGMRRNKAMAGYADAMVAVWDGQSRGTRDMIRRMEKLGKPVYVHEVDTLSD